jgi:hypothetical protein
VSGPAVTTLVWVMSTMGILFVSRYGLREPKASDEV